MPVSDLIWLEQLDKDILEGHNHLNSGPVLPRLPSRILLVLLLILALFVLILLILKTGTKPWSVLRTVLRSRSVFDRLPGSGYFFSPAPAPTPARIKSRH